MQTIQNHSDVVNARAVRRIRRHPDFEVLGQRSDAELHDWCGLILESLIAWLDTGSEAEVRRRFHLAGEERFEESVPLHEAVLRFQVMKDVIIDLLHELVMPEDTMQLYAEEELENRVVRFFDLLVYELVRGYEAALRRAVRYA
ncbi:MAG: hypothetical protein ACE15B_23135 [Bryobacteraceae bacterium]